MGNPQQSEEFWADVELIASAVHASARHAAYLSTGGSDGCAQCVQTVHGPELSFKERVERGHLDCAASLAATKGADRTVSGMSEVWIAISRAMEDPRFGQWVRSREAVDRDHDS